MLELCWKGEKAIELGNGVKRWFLQDDDEVILTGTVTTMQVVKVELKLSYISFYCNLQSVEWLPITKN